MSEPKPNAQEEQRFFRSALEYQGELLALLLRHTGNLSDAEELRQDVYVKLLDMPVLARPPTASLRAFLRKVATNTALDWIKRRKGSPLGPAENVESFEVPDGQPPVERILIGQQALASVERLIKNLPDRCRQVFTRRRLHGETIAAIAAAMNISEDTAKEHLARGDTHIRNRSIADPSDTFGRSSYGPLIIRRNRRGGRTK